MKVVLGLDVAEAAFNPTPGDANGVDQDLYEQRGNEWVRLVNVLYLYKEISALFQDYFS